MKTEGQYTVLKYSRWKINKMLKKAGYKGEYLKWYYLDYDGYMTVCKVLNLDLEEVTKIIEVSKFRRILAGIIARIHGKLFDIRYKKCI